MRAMSTQAENLSMIAIAGKFYSGCCYFVSVCLPFHNRVSFPSCATFYIDRGDVIFVKISTKRSHFGSYVTGAEPKQERV